MSDIPTPDEVEDAKSKGRMVAMLTRDHYEALIDAKFAEDEAFELAQAYHWRMIGGEEDD